MNLPRKPGIIINWLRTTPSRQPTSTIWKKFPASTLPYVKLSTSSHLILRLGCKKMRRKSCRNPTASSGRPLIAALSSSQSSKNHLLILSIFQTRCGRSLQPKMISATPAEQTMSLIPRVSAILTTRRVSPILQNWRKSGNRGLLEFKIKKTNTLKP